MKAIPAGTKEILDRALELEPGSELYLACETDHERDVLYADIEQRRLWLIKEDNLAKYEQIVINKKHLNTHPNIILWKLNILSACIKKADGSIEEVAF